MNFGSLADFLQQPDEGGSTNSEPDVVLQKQRKSKKRKARRWLKPKPNLLQQCKAAEPVELETPTKPTKPSKPTTPVAPIGVQPVVLAPTTTLQRTWNVPVAYRKPQFTKARTYLNPPQTTKKRRKKKDAQVVQAYVPNNVKTKCTKPLPKFFGNQRTLQQLFVDIVPFGKCFTIILSGPSGTGKSWALQHLVARWMDVVGPDSVLVNEDFELLIDHKLPFPQNAQTLIALDDVDHFIPRYVTGLRTLLASAQRIAPIFMTATDIYASKQLTFLRSCVRRKLYRCTYDKYLFDFVRSLKLPVPPPKYILDKAVDSCNGNLHQLKCMVTFHLRADDARLKHEAKSHDPLFRFRPKNERDKLDTVEERLTLWDEEKLFRKNTLNRPPSDMCALMCYYNLPTNVESCEDLSKLTQRYSDFVFYGDNKLFSTHGCMVTGDEAEFPRPYIDLSRSTSKVKYVWSKLTEFFEAWGYISGSSSLQDRKRDYAEYWAAMRPVTSSEKISLLLKRVGEKVQFLKDIRDVLFYELTS
ncbi:ATP-binding protein [bacterium]|nr:ATP-binding protein [bacterium]